MAVEFSIEKMEDAMRASLIIQQQNEILGEALSELAGDFGVSKALAKKIVTAYAKDTLEKTSEKLEDERSSLANADVMIDSLENMSFDPEDLLETTSQDSED
jgi:hypothetical protein